MSSADPNRGAHLTTHSVSSASVVFTGESREVETGGRAALSEIANIVTRDGLQAEISIQKFTTGEIHIRLSEFLTTPPPIYSHLNRNGTMTVQVRDDGKWVALLRALRPGGKEYETLNNVTWSELDGLLGADAKVWLKNLGFETGTWAELNPKAGRFKDSIAVAIAPANGNLLVLAWALTRVIALMNKLGKPSVVDLG
jgi:hypothetical protein